MNEYIFIDGAGVDNSIPVRSLFYGEGLFETFRYKNMLPVQFDKHLERMGGGAKLLKMPFPKSEYIKELVEKAVFESEIQDAYVKICLLSGGKSAFYETSSKSQVLVIIRKYVPPKQSVKLKVNSFKRISESPIYEVKSLNYVQNILARREAVGMGFDECLFLNEKDEITECSASNIFWFKDNTLFTPSIACGLLCGTTRDLILGFASYYGINAVEGRFNRNDLINSEFGFITNSLLGSVPVSEIEGNSLVVDHNLFSEMRNALMQKLKWV